MSAPNDRDDLGFALPEPARLSRGRALVIGAVTVVVLGAAVVAGMLPRQKERAALEDSARAALPRVLVVTPKPLASDRALALPGSVQSLEETTVYPRASGYVKRWLVDIGDKVEEGQVLAEIETPELDQEIEQARAQLAQSEAAIRQAQANRGFSKTVLDRAKQLEPAGLTSRQELEKSAAQAAVDDANVAVAEATNKSQQANMRRLAQIKSFARVTAPFAGRVVARTVERGALVTAGNATPLFRIASTDTVRVFVQVPQDVAPSVKVDAPAQVTVREYPGRTFDAKVTRSAGALDSQTRTMTVEVRVPNPKGELFSGMYAQVAFTASLPHRVFEVPGTALFSDGKGTRVAVVDDDGRIRMRPVTIERDTGPTLQLASGVDEGARVVKLASVELVEGAQVEVATGDPPK